VRYLIDEDLSHEVAEAARGLGLDAVSVQELGRRGLSDAAQLAFSIQEGRIIVTRNRDDFLALLVAAFGAGQEAPGVLVVPHTIPGSPASLAAHALLRWHDAQLRRGDPGACICDFLF